MSRRATRINDNALENLIAGARSGSLILGAAVVADLLAWLWTGDWRWAATAALLAVLGAVLAWWGWWTYGNQEWRAPLYDGARWGELHCNVPIDQVTRRHEGPHQDGLRDGEGLRTWS